MKMVDSSGYGNNGFVPQDTNLIIFDTARYNYSTLFKETPELNLYQPQFKDQITIMS